jgi:hypothetical protein
MALKDLVVSHAELTEEQIEGIVASHVRYDPSAPAIVLLPGAASLTNRQRILIYLVALRGWPFVRPEDPPPTGATPSELERALQIPGGSLRPLLKQLRDARLVEESDGRYSVNPVSFPFVQQQIEGVEENPPPRPRPRPRARTKAAKRGASSDAAAEGSEDDATEIADDPAQKPPDPPESKKRVRTATRTRRDATVSGTGPLQRLRGFIAGGYFAQPKSTRDIVAEFAKRGANYKRTDLTRQLITLVRSDELSRDMVHDEQVGRKIWKYVAS